MTQEQLAEAVGVSKRSVGSWERGEAIPRNRVGAIAELFGLDDDTPEFGPLALRRRLGVLAKRRREELGLSFRSLAVEAGLGSDKTVRNFEFAQSVPSPVVQRKLERVLGWRLGVIDDVLGLVNRKASSIEMEELDAEDSLYVTGQGGVVSLSAVPDSELLEELGRRLARAQVPVSPHQGLYDLAASTNSEHLEDEDE